ncbi:MAG: FHA domain-containing protein [Pyrinomonadaceae bacterium]
MKVVKVQKNSRRKLIRPGIFIRRAVITLTLLAAVAAGVPVTSPPGFRLKLGLSPTAALAQDDPLQSLSNEYAKLEREGLAENAYRQVAYMMLRKYLPTGTRFTSGYRSPDKQLDLILRYARARGIPTPAKASIQDESSWRPALMGLRAKGVIIAAPTTTPHGTDEAVFDLSGADLGAIQKGLRQAETAGVIQYKRIILEPQNNAVHVEVAFISPKLLKEVLGKGSGTGIGGQTTVQPANVQQSSMLQQLQNLHDGEPDPEKKIDYDRSKRNLLDPAIDAARIRAIDVEIERHEKEVELLGSQSEKKAAIARVSEALMEERYEDAESGAEDLLDRFPDLQQAQSMLAQIKTRRLVNEAMDALYATDVPGCSECRDAEFLLGEALALSPGHEGAQVIKEDVDACLERCKPRPVLAIVLSVFALIFAAAVSVGIYFWMRSGKKLPAVAALSPKSQRWVLEGVEGACRGQVFPLEKGEIIIGSKAPPEGIADIVVYDTMRKISRRHCTIMQNGKQFYLVDDSTNGTKLNDREIPRGVTVEFRQGDRISLADEAVLQLTRR